MEILPNTIIKVLNNVPLRSDYKDTLYFESPTDQANYFSSCTKFTFQKNTYQRVNKGKIRINKVADDLYDCNYVMFQNSSYGHKWFYAFIESVEYINNAVSEITYKLDCVQTWFFDMIIKQCFVEREHSVSDNEGDNLVTENIDLGFYREEPAEVTPFFDSYTAVIATSFDSKGKTGGYKGGLFTGLNYIPALVDNKEEVQSLVDLLDNMVVANKIDSITSIFMMPTIFYTNDDTPVLKRFDAKKETSKIGSYTPKNKKLLTYPFNFLYVFTPDGSNAIYHYEYFQNENECGFNIQCAMSCNPEIIAEPIAYQNQQFNIDESISMGNFPQCAYSIDSFKAWLAQNSTSTLLNLASVGIGMYTGNVDMTMGALGMAGTVNNAVQSCIKPPIVKGTQGNSTFTGTREKNFYFVNKHISEEYAKIIDDYFNMFGYACHRVKIPNISSRPHWNYVKTKGCEISGSVPCDDLKTIENAFDSGIRFWKHGSEVGNFSLNNSPT